MTKTNSQQNEIANKQAVLDERNIADAVLNRIATFEKSGALNLPKDYSVGNALKFAWLMLTETVDKEKRPVLSVASKESVANALLQMCIQGLNPMKKQCYFIAYGSKLEMQRSYQGSVAVAKRYSTLVEINANIIYNDDEFVYGIDNSTGRMHIVKHEQHIENIDINKIKGAYAVAIFNDGTSKIETMTILQIKKAWAQGKGGGNTMAHQNFTDEMAKKTVINRLCKSIINSSDDTALFDDEKETPTVYDAAEEEIIEKENKIEMRLQQPAVKPVDEVQEVDYTEVSAGAESKQQSIPGF